MYHGIHDISNVSNLLGGFMKKLIRCLFIVCILCFSVSPVYARAGGGGGGGPPLLLAGHHRHRRAAGVRPGGEPGAGAGTGRVSPLFEAGIFQAH